MAPKKIIALQVIGIGILVGCGAWLFVSFGNVSSLVTCFLDQIDVLKSVKGTAGKQSAAIAAQIPDNIVSLVRTYVPLLAVFVIVPAALIAIIELLVVFCASNPCKNSRMDEVCAKLLILFLQVFLLIGIICYLVIGGAGIAINQPFAQQPLKQVDNVCLDGIPKLDLVLADAQVKLDAQQLKLDNAKAALPPGAPSTGLSDLETKLASAQTELDEANKGVGAMKQVCKCIKDTFAILPTFTAPGLGCAVGCIILMILNWAACCALGICGGKKKTGSDSTKTEVQQEV